MPELYCNRQDCAKWVSPCIYKYRFHSKWCLNFIKGEVENTVSEIKLNWLRQKHFKGINEFKLQVFGKNATVFGDNGTFKTSQFDSELWLLFGKDSTDRSQFKVKPQDTEGNDIHYLQTEVEAEYLVDGKPLLLKKMQEEKWTKKHGSSEKELTGNTISYWVDEVPCKENEYLQKIDAVVKENLFRAITNPLYFNTSIKWQDRRKILLQICGDMTDAEVIASDKKLTKLISILDGKSIEDYKKILAERIKKLGKDRDDISPRIDELSLSIPQVQPDYSAVEKELQSYKDQMTGIELEMTNASNAAAGYRRKQQELYGLKGKLDIAKTRIDNEANSSGKELVNENSKLDSEKYRLESDISGFKTRIEQNKRIIESNSDERQKLIEKWKGHNETKGCQVALTFTEPDENNFTCPMCNRSLPNEAKESKLEEMRSNFERDKVNRIAWVEEKLSQNKTAGIALKSSTEILQTAIDNYAVSLNEAELRLEEVKNRLADIEIILSETTIDAPDYSTDTEYASIQEQIASMQAELNKPIEDTTAALLQNKSEVQVNIDACNKTLNNKTTAENTKKRIEELKADEKRIAAQITEMEGHKYLLEQFVITKVNLMDSNINSRFKFVRFKMFNEQVNQGIDECCDAMVDGVPFSDVNHGKKINAGLDVINTLCSYYGVTAPIFIDFAESVSELIETNSQIISLVKPETFVKLDKVLQDSLIVKYGSYEAAKKFWNDRNKTLRVEVEV